MLHISNLDEGKPGWNVNETHIIIPMIDGDIIPNKESDKIATSTITLNTLDGGDQTILTNGLEHSLVIGLDRNLFETHNNKSDLLVIQNSDLKLLSCNSDMKNPVTYTLSYVDQDRSEILWESPVSKDKTKLEWCSNDKTIFEVKDVLNYDDSVQDSSKNWHNDLEKGNDQINLDDVAGDLTSQVAKINSEILIPVDDVINENKKSDDIGRDNHFIVNYYPLVQNNEGISLLPVSTVVAKPVEKNIKPKTENLISNELLIKSCNSKSAELLNPGSLKETQENILAIMPGGYDKSVPSNYQETEIETKIVKQIKTAKEFKGKEVPVANGVSSSLPEKSLPLKKKAKMKRTMAMYGPENVKSLLKQEVPSSSHSINFAESKPLVDNPDNSDSDEPLINKFKKKRKLTKSVQKNQKQKSSASLVHEQGELIRFNVSLVESDDKTPSTKFFRNNFDDRNFNNIFDLVDELKKYRLINASVWETLRSGLKEMNVDILKEMNANKQKNKTPGDIASYSTQLKAFALVLYFKQPAAFNHLSKLYSNGWPSLAVIKDWKRRVNSHQRPNFVGLQRGPESDKPKLHH